MVMGKVPTGAGKHPSDPRTGWDPAWNDALTKALPVAMACNGSSHKTWTDTPGANENAPINCVYWVVALAFCAWDGGRLPTEAEWQYAAYHRQGGQKPQVPLGRYLAGWSSPGSADSLTMPRARSRRSSIRTRSGSCRRAVSAGVSGCRSCRCSL
ncbi:SUMF1/EgtB/PvdO family nonheme iron enzyme [Sorangium sp. So ce834]|uniref:SUMF1/EgtB/PvdO family nonheme iron enzyme n=1 Tax=Sorangium sp. So ce834 TaxID=3133321 RepID=UPI003F642198